MRSRPRLIIVLTVVAVMLAGLGVGHAGATHPEGEHPIHPGVQTVTGNAQCTANFVFADDSGDVYIGQAAHCAGTNAVATNIDGCAAESLPLGTPVRIEGAENPGELVYSSWLTMQAVGERQPGPCLYNDLALVELSDQDAARVSPALPVSNGPVGLETGGTTHGGTLYAYGASSLRLGVQAGTPRQGTDLGTSAGGWLHTAAFATPGIPGDSGAAVVDGEGFALGILNNLNLAPLAGTNGVSDLSLALQYLNDKATESDARLNDSPVRLVTGPAPFEPPGAAQGLLGGGSGGLPGDGSASLLPGVGGVLKDLPLLGG